MKKIYQYIIKNKDKEITHAVFVVEKLINYQIFTNLVGQLENFLIFEKIKQNKFSTLEEAYNVCLKFVRYLSKINDEDLIEYQFPLDFSKELKLSVENYKGLILTTCINASEEIMDEKTHPFQIYIIQNYIKYHIINGAFYIKGNNVDELSKEELKLYLFEQNEDIINTYLDNYKRTNKIMIIKRKYTQLIVLMNNLNVFSILRIETTN
jgi:hypothetical protein